MKRISSRQNALFKRVRRAIDEHAEEIVIEGPKAIDDAIANGWKPLVIVRRDEDFAPALFDTLSGTITSQGVIALFERPSFGDLFADRDRIIVALDGVQDPGNVGTIVRLSAAFDAAGVILLPGCADAYGPKAIRASAGAILSVPVIEMTVDQLLARHLPIFAADAHGSSELPNGILVFGSEGRGISDALRRVARLVRIETSGRVESLNVAAAAAILLWRRFNSRS